MLAALSLAQPWPILYASDRAPNLHRPVLRDVSPAGADVRTLSRLLPQGAVSVSPDGRIAAVSVAQRASLRSRLELVPVRGGPTRVIGTFPWVRETAWSPDSRRLTFDVGCVKRDCGRADLWIVGASARRARRLAVRTTIGDWSPDSRELAVVRQRGRVARDRRRWIYLLDPDTGRTRIVTRGEEPAWSPDGRRLAYYLDSWVHTVRPDGRGAARVAVGDAPAWSPDGHRLAFVQDGWTPTPTLMVSQAGGGRPRRLLHASEWDLVGWTPDGRGVVVSSVGASSDKPAWIRVVDLHGAARTLARTELGASVDDFRWTRASRLRYLETLVFHAEEIWSIEPDGSGPLQLTHDTSDDYLPARAPDGHIAYTHADSIWSMNADGGAPHVVESPPNGWADWAPAWSPDGSWIAFTRFSTGAETSSDIWIVHPDGTDAQQLTHDRDASLPTWSPDGSRIAYQLTSQIQLISLDGSGERTVAYVETDVPETSRPRWSPDGSWIAFDEGGAVVIVHPDGTGRRRVGAGRSPAWSPDGSTLVVRAGPVEPYFSQSYLRLLGLDGTVSPRLTFGPETARDPAWAP